MKLIQGRKMLQIRIILSLALSFITSVVSAVTYDFGDFNTYYDQGPQNVSTAFYKTFSVNGIPGEKFSDVIKIALYNYLSPIPFHTISMPYVEITNNGSNTYINNFYYSLYSDSFSPIAGTAIAKDVYYGAKIPIHDTGNYYVFANGTIPLAGGGEYVVSIGNVLRCTPEPETYMLMLSGIGLIRWITRCRKNAIIL